MSTELAKNFNNEEFIKLASSSYLPRLQLFSSSSEACKRGEIGVGKLGIVRGRELIEVGNEIHCCVVSIRLKAMYVRQPIKICYNPNDNIFREFVQKSKISNSGYLAGPEFLLYSPDHSTYCTFYMYNATMRREAPVLAKLINQMAVIKVNYIVNNTYSWHGVVVTKSSKDLPELPEKEVIDEFNNPVDMLEEETVEVRQR